MGIPPIACRDCAGYRRKRLFKNKRYPPRYGSCMYKKEPACAVSTACKTHFVPKRDMEMPIYKDGGYTQPTKLGNPIPPSQRKLVLPKPFDVEQLEARIEALEVEYERVRKERNFLKEENDMLKYDLRHCRNQLASREMFSKR